MKKLLSIILTVCMLFSLVIVPVTVNAEETATVTFQYLDETIETVSVAKGETIDYLALKPLAAEINYDHVWSKNAKKYEEAPTVVSGDITVYELESKVLSFENYPISTGACAAAHGGSVPGDMEFNTTVSTEEACSGTHSMKLRDHYYRLRDSEPSNWATEGWKTHYIYDPKTETATPLTDLYTDAPDFVANTFAYQRAHEGYESGMTVVKLYGKNETPISATYKVTFKYKATANNTAASTIQPRLIVVENANWGAATKPTFEGSFTIPAGATDGWQTAEFTISADGITNGDNWKAHIQGLDLQWKADTTKRYTKEIYIDDVRVINVNDIKGVTYVSPDSSTEFIEYEAGDTITYPTTNPGGATNYNTHYAWSATQGTYTQPPTTFTDNVSVYWVETDVMKFQHDIPVLNLVYDPSKYPSAKFANEGYDDHRSVRIRNYNVRTTTTQLTESNCTTYYYYDEASDSYKAITLDMFKACNSNHDEFVATYGGIYQWRAGGLEQTNLSVYQYGASSTPFTDNAKITFKYKFTGKNNGNGFKVYAIIAHSGDGNWGSVKFSSQAITIPYSDSDEWQTVSLYTLIDTNNATMTNQDKKAVLALKFEDVASYANASTFTILVDDVKYETFTNTPTLYLHNGDDVDVITEADGLTPGVAYTPAVPTAPEGKTFAGWAATSNGSNLVQSITLPSAGSGKALVADYYAIFSTAATVHYHEGEEVTKVTDGVTAGAQYTIDRISQAPAGKYFAGWSTDPEGTDFVTKVTMPSAGDTCEKHLYAIYKDAGGDKTFKFNYSEPTANGGVGYKINGTYGYQITGNGHGQNAGWGTPYAYTANGLEMGKDTYGGAYKYQETHEQVGEVNIGDTVGDEDNVNVGEYADLGFSEAQAVVIRDANGEIFVPKSNTKYAALVTYKRIGDGTVTLRLALDRKPAFVTGSFANNPAQASATVDVVTNNTKENYPANGDNSLKTSAIYFTTPEYVEGGNVPVLSLLSESYLYGRRLEGESITTSNDKTYYPYEVTGHGRLLITEIQIIEIDEENSVVAYNYYENGGFTTVIKEGVKGSALDVDTKNFDTKWYSNKLAEGRRIVTTYPEASFINYYNAAYTQIEHPNADGQDSVFLFGDGKKKGSAEKTMTFENALYDGKYSLHVVANSEVITNDYEVFMLEKELVPGNTYKVSFKYKTGTENNAFGINLTTSHNGGFGWFDSNDTPVKATVNIDAGESTGEWTERVVYFTADFVGSVTGNNEIGRDYEDIVYSDRKTLYFNFFQDGANDIYFADFVIEDLGTPVVAAGASKLKDDYANQIEQQAIRYYFNYKTVDGSTLEFSNGDTLRVVERGFYFRNGLSYATGADFTVPLFKDSTVKSVKEDEFHKCWAYNQSTGIMTFSTYVTNFGLHDARKLEVRGYVKVIDEATGEKFTIYANESINRTVDGIFGDEATDNDINTGLGNT